MVKKKVRKIKQSLVNVTPAPLKIRVKLEPDDSVCWIQILIRVESWIRILIKVESLIRHRDRERNDERLHQAQSENLMKNSFLHSTIFPFPILPYVQEVLTLFLYSNNTRCIRLD